jgi:hypothetical protein
VYRWAYDYVKNEYAIPTKRYTADHIFTLACKYIDSATRVEGDKVKRIAVSMQIDISSFQDQVVTYDRMTATVFRIFKMIIMGGTLVVMYKWNKEREEERKTVTMQGNVSGDPVTLKPKVVRIESASSAKRLNTTFKTVSIANDVIQIASVVFGLGFSVASLIHKWYNHK